MNLVDLLTRKDKRLAWPAGVRVTKRSWGGEPWRAVRFPNRERPELRIAAVADSHPLWTQPDTIGWYAAAAGGARLEVAFLRGRKTISRRVMQLTEAPAPVVLPWPQSVAAPDDLALMLRVTEGAAEEIEILVHRALSRQPLYDLARGRGVEVGPGPRPQILPSAETDVLYIEETPPERWAELYDQAGSFEATTADWSRIQIGLASDLPVPDGTLDFIFSSHVFEHLANPLGHLRHWFAKLKPGGVAMAVVPDLTSTKDRYMRPCGLAEIEAEYAAGILKPELRHYLRNSARLGKAGDETHARELMAQGASIHVHFYTRENMAAVLRLAMEKIGYAGFQLHHAQNHKDFHFVLRK